MKPTPFQLTKEDIRGSLEESDIGLWCFSMNGCIQGFFQTKEECQSCIDNLYRD